MEVAVVRVGGRGEGRSGGCDCGVLLDLWQVKRGMQLNYLLKVTSGRSNPNKKSAKSEALSVLNMVSARLSWPSARSVTK